jgi:hypothetical protein
LRALLPASVDDREFTMAALVERVEAHESMRPQPCADQLSRIRAANDTATRSAA